MRSAIQWWRVHFLGAEMGLAVVMTLGFAVWVEKYAGSAVLSELLRQNRSALYGTLASIFGSLLGFAITTVSIAIGFSQSDRLAIVRESKHYPTLWKVFVSTIKFLGVATIISLVALLLDRDSRPNSLVMYGCFLLVAISILRVVRSVWVLEQIIAIVTAPSKEKMGNQ